VAATIIWDMQTRDNSALDGYLVIADISGYSAYLATTELEYSPEILAELLELIVHHLQPPLHLSKLEGDAVFLHAPDQTFFRGETLLELIEKTYAAFRDRIRAIERNKCDCAACRKSPALDLKFVVHHGPFRTHRVAGHEEVVGKDVALVHRLLKNGVAEANGWRGYALFSDEALQRLGVEPEGLYRRTETYDLGAVDTASVDLDGRYQCFVEARRVFVAPEEADVRMVRRVAASPAVTWEWLNDPNRRRQWEDMVVEPQMLPGGRSGVGEVSRCVRGTDVRIMTTLDWRPFDYFTVESRTLPSAEAALTSYRLAAVDSATDLEVTVALPDKRLKRRKARQTTEQTLGRSLDRLAAAIAGESPPREPEPLEMVTTGLTD
jgi:hypothetical protein